MIIEVDEHNGGRRLDVIVAEATGLSRSRVGELLTAGAVVVDGRAQRKSYRAQAGEVVEVGDIERPTPPVPTQVEVVWSDDHVVVVDKASGMVVHRAPGLEEATLVDALVHQGVSLAGGDPERPGVVHRLDREVSGLLVLAKTEGAYGALVRDMAARRIDRRYLALVEGSPSVDRGKIEAPIGRDPQHRTRMAVLPEGRRAVTWFDVRERFDPAALLEVQLETGRTHQIRVHLASIGHAIVGDPVYGRDRNLAREVGLRRPFLHAYRLSFDHPATGERVEFTSEMPDQLVAALEELR